MQKKLPLIAEEVALAAYAEEVEVNKMDVDDESTEVINPLQSIPAVSVRTHQGFQGIQTD